ncbi:MFS general substrate transporter [Apiospora saccharicola]|uniref:MFS general substrate transporter n=1 Tax=Apiospora saccharicola TaxID=335842 RepID=A0ABR1WCP1_9PEZI
METVAVDKGEGLLGVLVVARRLNMGGQAVIAHDVNCVVGDGTEAGGHSDDASSCSRPSSVPSSAGPLPARSPGVGASGSTSRSAAWFWAFWSSSSACPNISSPVPATWTDILLQLDIPGFGPLVASLVCLTLALQWGDLTKHWNDGSVIAALVMWILLTIAFVVTEYFQGARAMVPLRLPKPRMAWTNTLYGWIASLANFQVTFYLPVCFQSIHGQSAIMSGVNTLPCMAFFALGPIVSGTLIGKTRHLQPYELAIGLLATAVLFGLGIGLGNQVPMTAVQGFSKPEEDIASSTGVMLMCDSISGAYFVAAAQGLFSNRLLETLAVIAPSIDPAKVLITGATEIQDVFAGEEELRAGQGRRLPTEKEVATAAAL